MRFHTFGVPPLYNGPVFLKITLHVGGVSTSDQDRSLDPVGFRGFQLNHPEKREGASE